MPTRIIGVDVGGTKIQVGVVNQAHRVISSTQVPNDISDKQKTLTSIYGAIEGYFSRKHTGAIGIGITGQTDPRTGIVIESPNLPRNWHRVPLRSLIQKKFNVPVYIDNDANCTALAEAWIGRGKTHRAVVNLTIGTGIGAGIVIDRQIFRGGNNATEFGHTMMDGKNTLEQLVSGPAIERSYFQYTKVRESSYEILAKAKKGSRTAKKVIREASRWLGLGIRNAIYAYSPDAVVLGGGLAQESLLTKPAIQLARKHVVYKELARIPILVSSLKYNAGVIGAALLYSQKDKV